MSSMQITRQFVGTRTRPANRRYYLQKCINLLHRFPDYIHSYRPVVPFVTKFPRKRLASPLYPCTTKCQVVPLHTESGNNRASDKQVLSAIEIRTSKKYDNVNVLFTNEDLKKIFRPLMRRPQPPHNFALAPETILRHLDAEYSNILDTLSDRDIVNSLLFLYGRLKEDVRKLKLYNRSLEVLGRLLKDIRWNPHYPADTDSFIQLMKIFAFNKEGETAVAKSFFNRLSIEHLSERQLYVALSCAFKGQILLQPKQVHQVEQMLNTPCRDVASNPRLLVTLCKVIRQAGSTGSQNFQNLVTQIIRREHPYNVATSAHVLAFFAETRLMYPEVVARLVADALNHYTSAKNNIPDPMKHTLRDEASYVYKYKYLDTILWATGRLRYNYKPRELDIFEKFIREHLPHLVKQQNRLINIMLSLWMLERRLEKELSMCFDEGLFRTTMNDPILWKPKARLHLLVNCVKIESSSLTIPRELLTDVNIGTEVSEAIQSVHQIVNKFSMQMKLRNVEMNRPVKGIFITGVSFRHMSAGNFHIDVLGNSNCLLPERRPDGLLNLKIRLLKKLGYQSIIIDENSLSCFEETVTIIEACMNTVSHRR